MGTLSQQKTLTKPSGRGPALPKSQRDALPALRWGEHGTRTSGRRQLGVKERELRDCHRPPDGYTRVPMTCPFTCCTQVRQGGLEFWELPPEKQAAIEHRQKVFYQQSDSFLIMQLQ